MLSERLYEKNRKIGELSYFEKGKIVGSRLTGASVTKTALFLTVWAGPHWPAILQKPLSDKCVIKHRNVLLRTSH
jgi:hypothetical protein